MPTFARECRRECPRHLIRPIGVRDDSIGTRELRRRVVARDDDREAARESLEHREREALRTREHDDAVRAMVQRDEVAIVELAGRDDVDAERARELEIARETLGALSSDDEARAYAERCEPANRRAEVLLRPRRAGREHQRCIVEFEAPHELALARFVALDTERRADAPRHDVDLARSRDELRAQLARDEFARRRDRARDEAADMHPRSMTEIRVLRDAVTPRQLVHGLHARQTRGERQRADERVQPFATGGFGAARELAVAPRAQILAVVRREAHDVEHAASFERFDRASRRARDAARMGARERRDVESDAHGFRPR